MHPSAIETYCPETDSQNHILQIRVLEDVHCSVHEFNKFAFPAELLYKNFVSLHRESVQTFVLRKRNARTTEPACGRCGRKRLLRPQAVREPDVPVVLHVGQTMVLEDVQLASG